MNRVYCLYRVSTVQQLHEDDIPMQRQACREFAAARGKSILYELIVCAGYVCGIAGKFLSAQTGWVVYIYILDLMMVLTDVALTLRNRYLDRLADERMRREHA